MIFLSIIFIIIIIILYIINNKINNIDDKITIIIDKINQQNINIDDKFNKIYNKNDNVNSLYEIFKNYIIPMFNITMRLPMINDDISKINTSINKLLNSKINNLFIYTNKIHVLVSHLAVQLYSEKVLELNRKNLSDIHYIQRACRIGDNEKNIDMPRDLKGDIGENIVCEILSKSFTNATIVDQSKNKCTGDLMMIIDGKKILIEVKNWHHDVDIINVNKFFKYAKREQYIAAILVNIDIGRIVNNGKILSIENDQFINGCYIKYNKPLIFIPSLTYNFTRLIEEIKNICKFLQIQY